MSAALDPATGLFPGTREPAFVLAPEVRELADQVLSKWNDLRLTRELVRDGRLSIAYVFETKPFDPNGEEFKPHTIAKVSKASPLWKSLTGYDLVIQFRRTFWVAFSEHQREAVLFHEFLHVDPDVDETKGGVKIALRGHDVEEFELAARRYGPALPGRKALVKAFASWQREQGGEVVPLRPVEELAAFDEFVDEVLDGVVDQVNAGALDDIAPGTTATITRAPRRTAKAD